MATISPLISEAGNVGGAWGRRILAHPLHDDAGCRTPNPRARRLRSAFTSAIYFSLCLGADYETANGRYRLKKVYGGLNWNPQLRAPLTEQAQCSCKRDDTHVRSSCPLNAGPVISCGRTPGAVLFAVGCQRFRQLSGQVIPPRLIERDYA